MLLDNYKFHVRVYLLVTSYHPTRIALYNDGLLFTAAKDIAAAQSGDRDGLLSNRAVAGNADDRRLSWFWEHVGAARAHVMRERIRRALAQLVGLYVPLSSRLQLVSSLKVYETDERVSCDVDVHARVGENGARPADKLGCFDLVRQFEQPYKNRK